ncbi:hypothetical protein H4R20_005047, partial [Coemansia guatemalensis]
MDFSQSHSRLGGSGSGGAHMVRTYGRFKERIFSREAIGAQEFARVTARPKLPDILDSSSDSDFEEPKPKIRAPSKAKPRQSIEKDSKATSSKENIEFREKRSCATGNRAPSPGTATQNGTSRRAPSKAESKPACEKPRSRNKSAEPTRNAKPKPTRKAAPKRKPSTARQLQTQAATAHTKELDKTLPNAKDLAPDPPGVVYENADIEPHKVPSCIKEKARTDDHSASSTSECCKSEASPPMELPESSVAANVESRLEENTVSCEGSTVANDNAAAGTNEQIQAASQSPISSGNVTRRRGTRSRRSASASILKVNRIGRLQTPAAKEETLPPTSDELPSDKLELVAELKISTCEQELTRRLSHIEVRKSEVFSPPADPVTPWRDDLSPNADRTPSGNTSPSIDRSSSTVCKPESPALSDSAVPGISDAVEATKDKHVTPDKTMEASAENGSPATQQPYQGTRDTEDGDEQGRQHFATRVTRFKAPRNARVQTFEIDDTNDTQSPDIPEAEGSPDLP